MPPEPAIRQIPLDLPLPPRRGSSDYVVGEANRAAHDLIVRWPDWPARAVLLVGPEGSGKSHLAGLWAGRSGAAIVAARDLAAADPLALAAAGPIGLEDLGPGLEEAALFHLLNAVGEAGHSLLMTARSEPASWGLGLPDLASRLRAAAPVRLDEPDDRLLEALLEKLFADRQTTVDPTVVRYLARRMERSYAAATTLVDALDRAALAAKSGIGRSLAARILSEIATPGAERDEPGLDDGDAADAQSS